MRDFLDLIMNVQAYHFLILYNIYHRFDIGAKYNQSVIAKFSNKLLFNLIF